LRGKQFELIALQELGGLLEVNRDKISPVIEPVKYSTTLKNTLVKLMRLNINFTVIINPEVGDLVGDLNRIISLLESEVQDFDNFQPGIILNRKANFKDILEIIKRSSLKPLGITLIHNEEFENIGDIIGIIESQYFHVINNIINFSKTGKRYYREFDPETRISLDDYFRARDRNKDYLLANNSAFSEEHIYYRQDGYKGFGDYLTIGEAYSETGALPYAVAIHISYVADDKKIRVKHFVSDSNDDQSDVGRKFAEALEKLVGWADSNDVNTIAINQFRELHKMGHFPGLGSLKKLSVMNHIEVVLSLI